MGHALTKPQREALAALLRARQQALAAQLLAREQGRSPAEQALVAREEDGNDARQLASEHEVEAALSGIEHRELAALAAALKRVHDADYGLCTACGRGIPFGRLKVEPQARRCVACEALREKKNTL
jgi:DnaK suppressor protein